MNIHHCYIVKLKEREGKIKRMSRSGKLFLLIFLSFAIGASNQRDQVYNIKAIIL